MYEDKEVSSAFILMDVLDFKLLPSSAEATVGFKT